MWISLPHDRYYDEGYNITQCFRVTHRCTLRAYTSATTYNEKEYLCDADSLEYYDIRSLQNIGADMTINESLCSPYRAYDSAQIGTAIDLNGVVKGYYIIQLGDEEKAIIAGKVSRKIDKYLWRTSMTWTDGTPCVVVLSNQRVTMYNSASEAEVENENWMLDLGAYANGQTPCLRQVVLNHDSPAGFNVKPHKFSEIHPDRLSFSQPVQQAFTKDGDTSVQWYGWKIAIDDAERYNALDRFTEDMYCVSEADIEEVGGWHTEAELAELGYTLYVEPAVTIQIAYMDFNGWNLSNITVTPHPVYSNQDLSEAVLYDDSKTYTLEGIYAINDETFANNKITEGGYDIGTDFFLGKHSYYVPANGLKLGKLTGLPMSNLNGLLVIRYKVE